MTFKNIVNACLSFCITAILVIALCGCDDLGAYGDAEEYYDSFGKIVLISQKSGKREYSVKDYFYNEESRDDFLEGDDGAYDGVEHSDYVYIAIPFKSNINMDTLALYIQSKTDTTVYMNVYLTNIIPSQWRPPANLPGNGATQGGSGETPDDESGETTEEEYDDPNPEKRIGEIVVHLQKDEWDSFMVEEFNVNGTLQQSIEIKDGQYILIQIRNNSGIRVFDQDKKAYVDPQTGLELQKAEITMTNLLVRALDIESGNQAQGGE